MSAISRRRALGIIGTTAAASLFGMPAIGQARTKINVGALRFTSHAASFVAFERGYFEEAGFDVEFKFFQAAQPMAVAIASGDADYAVTAISGGLISLAEKGAIKVIGGALSEESGIYGQQILASNAAYDAGLTSPAQLDGHSFGITQAGSSFHYMGSKIASAESAKLKFKPLQKTGAIIGAIKSGQIDAWTIVPHIAKPLADAGAWKIIGSVADYLPDYQVTTLFTSASNARDKAEQNKAFLAAFARGAADFNAALVDKTAGTAAHDDMVRLIHKYVYTDKDYEQAAPGIINGAMRINEGAAMNLASIKDQLDWFKSEGLVKDSIDIDTVVDSSYVRIIGQ
ncbi:ABC transporter substrate-binding protein [Granulosicoccus antarcticus]|uniref:SsuA/THI5-like domain-containing protein n=1 Tax=Granulosicoccus antarcticus IMCC3135 TaxID=1192854 RepID=A0A2Z2NSB0_9GAMM|nr:ABC transporter substrate-binding protein [Granulosicoccus antarcticus]ASJ70457.1 hypothetical protein IMCC3135_01690 [Granulosicoccus antarcticus IMCC3135]